MKYRKFSFKIREYIRKKDALERACKVADRTVDSVNHFYEIYLKLGKGKSGAPSHSRQDLLRAMLVFASAGMDMFLKQIIRDSLWEVIEVDKDAQKMFAQFIERRLKVNTSSETDNNLNIKLIANALSSKSPKNILLKEYEQDLVSGSLQSRDEIFKVAAAFAITTEKILKNIKPDDLKEVFLARNDVIHEMDIDFNSTKKSNTQKRKQDEIVKMCKVIFGVMINFVTEVDLKLNYAKK